MSNVKWMPSALNDLKSIKEYIARDSIYYADKLANDIINKSSKLETFPKMGRVVPEIGDPSVREITHASYRIIYELYDDDVNIVAVIHGKRLLQNAFDDTLLSKEKDSTE